MKTFKKYTQALYKLYGATIVGDPASRVAVKVRSSNSGQKKRPRQRIEEGIQVRLVGWALNQDIPLMQIPNAARRSRIEGHRQKQMGLRPGASDLFLTRMCGGFGGYWIELKTPGEKPKPNQIAFMEQMRREGYKAEWFDDFAKAQQSILDYLNLDKEAA